MSETQAVATEPITQPSKRTPKPIKEYAKPKERLIAAAALIDAGMTPKEAAKQLGYAEKYVPGMVQRIRNKGISEFVTEKRLKSAKNVIDTFMQGKPIGVKREKDEEGRMVVVAPGISPKDSTIKDCAMSVLDRAYPKKEEFGSTSVSFTKIDLTIYQTPQHVVYTQAQREIDVTP